MPVGGRQLRTSLESILKKTYKPDMSHNCAMLFQSVLQHFNAMKTTHRQCLLPAQPLAVRFILLFVSVWMTVLPIGCAPKDQFLSAKTLPQSLQAKCILAETSDDHDSIEGCEDIVRAGFEKPLSSIRPAEQKFIIVNGLVNKPGEFAFPEGRDFRVLDAVARAEGISNKIVNTVVICRKQPNRSKRALILVSLHAATRDENENILLAPDDIVSVEPTPRMLVRDVGTYVGSAANIGGGRLMPGM